MRVRSCNNLGRINSEWRYISCRADKVPGVEKNKDVYRCRGIPVEHINGSLRLTVLGPSLSVIERSIFMKTEWIQVSHRYLEPEEGTYEKKKPGVLSGKISWNRVRYDVLVSKLRRLSLSFLLSDGEMGLDRHPVTHGILLQSRYLCLLEREPKRLVLGIRLQSLIQIYLISIGKQEWEIPLLEGFVKTPPEDFESLTFIEISWSQLIFFPFLLECLEPWRLSGMTPVFYRYNNRYEDGFVRSSILISIKVPVNLYCNH